MIFVADIETGLIVDANETAALIMETTIEKIIGFRGFQAPVSVIEIGFKIS